MGLSCVLLLMGLFYVQSSLYYMGLSYVPSLLSESRQTLYVGARPRDPDQGGGILSMPRLKEISLHLGDLMD